jgi:undecaprenyl-diphosphatase
MNHFDAIILGVVQGLTEFLPISSSGHLVLFQHLLGFREPEMLFDTALHFGTLLAVCIHFHRDLRTMVIDAGWLIRRPFTEGSHPHDSPRPSLLWWILVGSIPTALIGLLFKDLFEKAFGSVPLVGAMLLVTGILLLLTRMTSRSSNSKQTMGLVKALVVGTVQGIAIIPGISRSGATIACGLFLGLERELAGRFSFLLSIPAITGALALQLIKGNAGQIDPWTLIVGVFSSGLVGLWALKVLMGMVRQGRLFIFSPYCWMVGLVLLVSSLW